MYVDSDLGGDDGTNGYGGYAGTDDSNGYGGDGGTDTMGGAGDMDSDESESEVVSDRSELLEEAMQKFSPKEVQVEARAMDITERRHVEEFMAKGCGCRWEDVLQAV